ncbi:AraC family transcriptional regulator [Bifidobacterium asteroides]|uniref:Helix-turn-helix domain-containing protein n=1 Tax=Bifidobacterium asteroides TaxID=1684 RepID=A0A6N7TUQ1_9BIFI|nr:helix-turn-helix domain-containing protein [Bifidobacterium asteroides]MSD91176.1 helix-turn-helix domain-containing protein [Bifidobacterium asteroides]
MAVFKSAGRFIGTPGWIHERRTVDSFELILVEEGVLPLTVAGRQRDLKAGGLLLIPPGTPHEGSRRLGQEPLTFYWAHFTLPDWQRVQNLPDEQRNKKNQSVARVVLPLDFRLADNNRVTVMFNQLLDIYQRTYPNPSPYCSYFMTCLLMEISMGRPAPKNPQEADDEDSTLQKVQDWIRINACDRISVASVAENFNYSPSYLSTIYKRRFGIGITGQIRRVRIERAQELLLSTSMGVSQIAEACGYDDPKYFMRVFKRFSGLTPTRYRSSFSLRHYNNA